MFVDSQPDFSVLLYYLLLSLVSDYDDVVVLDAHALCDLYGIPLIVLGLW